MRKLILVLAAGLLIASCQKEDVQPNNSSGPADPNPQDTIVYNDTVPDPVVPDTLYRYRFESSEIVIGSVMSMINSDYSTVQYTPSYHSDVYTRVIDIEPGDTLNIGNNTSANINIYSVTFKMQRNINNSGWVTIYYDSRSYTDTDCYNEDNWQFILEN